MRGQYDFFSTKMGYNYALRHFKKVNSLLPKLPQQNLADLLKGFENKGELQKEQIKPILHALLVEKFEYSYESFNLLKTFNSFHKMIKEVSLWQSIDLVLLYYHDQIGELILNPKNINHWEKGMELTKDELVIVYAKVINPSLDPSFSLKAVNSLISIINGIDSPVPEDYKLPNRSRQSYTHGQAKTQKPVTRKPESKSKKSTPQYSVQITNELFHNGNVEAWKNIITSYEAKYKGSKVYVFHEGEQIDNLNALFKWGKVKTGGLIFFAVLGENLAGVSKLQRYLFEGASPRFETFLQKEVHKVLDLF